MQAPTLVVELVDHIHRLEGGTSRRERFSASGRGVEYKLARKQLDQMGMEPSIQIVFAELERPILELLRKRSVELQILHIAVDGAEAAPKIEAAEKVAKWFVMFVHCRLPATSARLRR
jgi:hypothetical protein